MEWPDDVAKVVRGGAMELTGRFEDEGSADQTPVLFLHAYPYHRAMWAGQVAALRGRARILTLDARGITPGLSAGSAYLLEHLVDDALALLDARAIKSCVVCGLSMGGYIAQRLVQRAPERVRGLLLANTQSAADSNEGKLARAEGLRLLWKDKQAFADAQLKRQLSAQTFAQRPQLVTKLREMILGASVEGLASNMVALATRTDLTQHLPEIRVPTTVVVGAHDVITTPAQARALADGIAGAKLHVLEGAGHLSNLEAEPQFNEQLLALLARV